MVYAEEGVASSSDNFNFIFGDEVNPNEDTFEMILKLADKDGKYRDIQTIAFNQIENKITEVNIFETSKGKLIGLEFYSGDSKIGVIGDYSLMADTVKDSVYEKKTESIKHSLTYDSMVQIFKDKPLGLLLYFHVQIAGMGI